MLARLGRIDLDTSIALLAVALLVVLAGCSGVSVPGGSAAGVSSATAEPPVSESDAENRSVTAEREYIRENEVPDGVSSWGWGGMATSKGVAVASTADGRFVRVRVGFYYNQDTDEGELHADGLSQAVYFVTPNATTRVSVPGYEMEGSSRGGGAEELDVRVVNTADGARDVSLSVQQVDGDTVYEGDTTVAGRSGAYTPRLSVVDAEYEVVATVDDQTERLGITVGDGSGSPTEVTVFVAPDGSVVLARTPSHL